MCSYSDWNSIFLLQKGYVLWYKTCPEGWLNLPLLSFNKDYPLSYRDTWWGLSNKSSFLPQSLQILRPISPPPLPPLSFFLYILPGARFRALSAGVHCTLRVAGWKPTSNHIEITVGFFNLHRGWLSLHRGHPVNVPSRRTMHLSSVIPANDTRESVFGHRNFSCRERESNLGPLAPEASA